MPRSSHTSFSQALSQAKAGTESGQSKLAMQAPTTSVSPLLPSATHTNHPSTFPTTARRALETNQSTPLFSPSPAMGSPLAALLQVSVWQWPLPSAHPSSVLPCGCQTLYALLSRMPPGLPGVWSHLPRRGICEDGGPWLCT